MSDTITSDANMTGAVAEKSVELTEILVEKTEKKGKKLRAGRSMSLSIPALKRILSQTVDMQGSNLDADTQTSILYESCLAGNMEPPRPLIKEMKEVKTRREALDESFKAQKANAAAAAASIALTVNPPAATAPTAGELRVGERVMVNDLANPTWNGSGTVMGIPDAFVISVRLESGQRIGHEGNFRRGCVSREVAGATPAAPRLYRMGDRVSVRVTGSRYWYGNGEVVRDAATTTDDVLVRMSDGPRAAREGTFTLDQLIFIAAAPSGRFRAGNRVVINEPTRPNWHNGTAEVITVNLNGTVSVRMLSLGIRTGRTENFNEDRLSLAAPGILSVTAAESTQGGRLFQAGDQVTVNIPSNPSWNGNGVFESFQGEYYRIRLLTGDSTGMAGNFERRYITLTTPATVAVGNEPETFTPGTQVSMNLGPHSGWTGNGTVHSAVPGGLVRVTMTSGSSVGTTGNFSRDQLTLGHVTPREFVVGDNVTCALGGGSGWNGNGTVTAVTPGGDITVSMTSGNNNGRSSAFSRNYVTLRNLPPATLSRPIQAGDQVVTNVGENHTWNGTGVVGSITEDGYYSVTMTSGRSNGQTTSFLRAQVSLVDATPAAPAAITTPLTVGSRVSVPTTVNAGWAGQGDVIQLSGVDANIRMVTGAQTGRTSWFAQRDLIR